MKKLLIAAAAAGLLLTAAACTDPSASAAPTQHSKTHKAHSAKSRAVTAKAHVSGGAYFLTLRGAHQPASVSKATFKRCQIGDRYPACADG
jgi:2,4-dienoyl-CoA reductase-like NADH-dependent reductase (Old Yellow Enzyme family)